MSIKDFINGIVSEVEGQPAAAPVPTPAPVAEPVVHVAQEEAPKPVVETHAVDAQETAFAKALKALWTHGDSVVKGLIEGMIATAPAVFAKYKINSNMLIAQLMAQISEECGAGEEVVENLNYTAQRMTEVWPSRFPSVGVATPYAHNPQMLANKVYNGRMGNVMGTNDGWKFRGRGATQTTGREGYQTLAKAVGLDVVNNPDILNDPKYFLECGVADFIACGCMPYALNDDVVGVTKKLNGGTIGLADREAWLAKWKHALA